MRDRVAAESVDAIAVDHGSLAYNVLRTRLQQLDADVRVGSHSCLPCCTVLL